MIDEFEGSLAGAPIDDTNIEVPTVDVKADADEDVTAGAKFGK